jgi:hypothetical protein
MDLLLSMKIITQLAYFKSMPTKGKVVPVHIFKAYGGAEI